MNVLCSCKFVSQNYDESATLNFIYIMNVYVYDQFTMDEVEKNAKDNNKLYP